MVTHTENLRQLEKSDCSIDYWIGQCFDGGNDISGEFSGVQKRNNKTESSIILFFVIIFKNSSNFPELCGIRFDESTLEDKRSSRVIKVTQNT